MLKAASYTTTKKLLNTLMLSSIILLNVTIVPNSQILFSKHSILMYFMLKSIVNSKTTPVVFLGWPVAHLIFCAALKKEHFKHIVHLPSQ